MDWNQYHSCTNEASKDAMWETHRAEVYRACNIILPSTNERFRTMAMRLRAIFVGARVIDTTYGFDVILEGINPNINYKGVKYISRIPGVAKGGGAGGDEIETRVYYFPMPIAWDEVRLPGKGQEAMPRDIEWDWSHRMESL